MFLSSHSWLVADNSVNEQQLYAEFTSIESSIRSHQDTFLISSKLAGNQALGKVFAILPYSIDQVRAVVSSPNEWCSATIFHINIKSCTTQPTNFGNSLLSLYIADEDYVEPELAEKISYQYSIKESNTKYVHINLDSAAGPVDTGDYLIDIRALEISPNETLIRLEYSMKIGLFTRALLKSYLATLGRNKVGFSHAQDSTVKEPRFIGGIEGVMERNTMRYLFAFESYLYSTKLPSNQQFNSALNHWFDYTLKYRKQLYEINRDEYLSRKTKEKQNQVLLQSSLTGSSTLTTPSTSTTSPSSTPNPW